MHLISQLVVSNINRVTSGRRLIPTPQTLLKRWAANRMANGSCCITRFCSFERPPNYISVVRNLKSIVLTITKLGMVHHTGIVIPDRIMVIVQVPLPPLRAPVVVLCGGGNFSSDVSAARFAYVHKNERGFGPMTAPASYGFAWFYGSQRGGNNNCGSFERARDPLQLDHRAYEKHQNKEAESMFLPAHD